MSNEALPPVPSVERYKDAFHQLESSLNENQKRMLKAHYAAPNHTITATELAEQVGYESFSAINLVYGNLGSRMRELMQYHGEGQASYVFASFYKHAESSAAHWQWIMHDNVARALEELGWV
jgi:hypothetical protein